MKKRNLVIVGSVTLLFIGFFCVLKVQNTDTVLDKKLSPQIISDTDLVVVEVSPPSILDDELILNGELIVVDNYLELDTKNWETYTNSQFGFEIKYPSAWEVIAESGDDGHGYDLLFMNRERLITQPVAFMNIYEGDIKIDNEDIIRNLDVNGIDMTIVSLSSDTGWSFAEEWYFENNKYSYRYVETFATIEYDVPVLQNIIRSFRFVEVI